MSCTNNIRRLPTDIIRDRILPLTYQPQPDALLHDIRSYYDTIHYAYDIYKNVDDAVDWLSNDICRFMNDDQPTMYGIVDFYKKVYKRMYMNQTSRLPDINIIGLEDNEDCRNINMSIGLLTQVERCLLILFLNSIHPNT